MPKRFRKELLYQLRNHIAIDRVLSQLEWPHKHREGRYCFLCPLCEEFLTAVNPRTNLGRCFRCQCNFNPIDLVMAIRQYDFVTAVQFLEHQLPLAPPATVRP
jgi:DNA primase